MATSLKIFRSYRFNQLTHFHFFAYYSYLHCVPNVRYLKIRLLHKIYIDELLFVQLLLSTASPRQCSSFTFLVPVFEMSASFGICPLNVRPILGGASGHLQQNFRTLDTDQKQCNILILCFLRGNQRPLDPKIGCKTECYNARVLGNNSGLLLPRSNLANETSKSEKLYYSV